MVAEMANSYRYWLRAAWNQSAPIAKDRSLTSHLNGVMARLGQRWQRKFDQAGKEIAAKFAAKSVRHFDTAMMATLKKAGFTVEFKMTRPVEEAARAVMAENVALIKSIPMQFHHDVQQHVWQSVRRGGDLGTLTKTIEDRYGVTHKRAAFIARDQNNKAHAAIENTRRLEIGMEEAIWRKGVAGKTHRQSHVEADGKKYSLKTGMYLDGKYTFPKHEPNCKCTSVGIIPALIKTGKYEKYGVR